MALLTPGPPGWGPAVGCEPLSSFLRVHTVGCCMCLSRYMMTIASMIWGWTASTSMLPDPKRPASEAPTMYSTYPGILSERPGASMAPWSLCFAATRAERWLAARRPSFSPTSSSSSSRNPADVYYEGHYASPILMTILSPRVRRYQSVCTVSSEPLLLYTPG